MLLMIDIHFLVKIMSTKEMGCINKYIYIEPSSYPYAGCYQNNKNQ